MEVFNSKRNSSLSVNNSPISEKSNGLAKIAGDIVQTEKSLEVFYSKEVNKSTVIRTEFEVWDDYDKKNS